MSQALQGLRIQFLQLQSSKDGRKVDLSNAIRSIEYFEDILLPSISMKLEVVSTVNIVSELMITGGEMVAMDLETGSGEFKFGELDGNGDIVVGKNNELYVYKVSAMDSQRQASKFTIHLVSAEYLINETSRCNFKFKSKKVDQLVRQILGPHVMNVNPDRISFIEETKNTYSFMGNMRKPFYTIQWLCPKSVSNTLSKSKGEDGKDGTTNGKAKGTSGFMFFENKNGFNFRSIDGLVSETREYEGSSDNKIANYEIHGTKQQPYEWRGMGAIDSNKFNANFQILNYIVEKNTDIRKALITGMYINQTQYYNVLTHRMSYYNYNLADEIEDKKLAGDPIPKIPFINDLEKSVSRFMFRISDNGAMGVGEDGLEPSGGENAERTDISKSLARYNLLFTQSLNISIPMNVNMKVGDIIRCRFPRLNSGESKEQDGNLSGKYLIRALHHHVEPNLNVTYLKLIRDSYGFSEPKIAT